MNGSPGQGHVSNNEINILHPTLHADLERQLEHQPVIPLKAPQHSTAFLDGLRGLAALFVFIQHYIGSFDGNVHEHGFGEHGNYYLASLPFLRIVFSGGSAAVAIFFVLSGYVLSKSPLRLLREGKRDECIMSLVSAVIRRPIRLYIPTFGVTLACALLMHAPLGIVPEVPWAPPKATVFAELANWLAESIKFFNPFQTHGSNRAWFTYNLVVWTIPIELKGSMLVFGIVAIQALSGLSQPLSLLLAVIVLLQIGKWTMACFIAGLILAYLDIHSMDKTYLSRHCSQRTQSLLKYTVFTIGYYLVCQPSHDGHPEYAFDTPGWYYLTVLTPKVYDKDQYYRYWHSWGAVLIVYSTLRISWLQQFLDTRPLRYLGKVSFMLYLVHLSVLGIFGNRLSRMLGQIPFGGEESWWDNRLYIPDIGPIGMSSRFLICLMIILSVCLAISDFGTRVLDTPSVKAGKWLVQMLGLDKRGFGMKEVNVEVAGLLTPSAHELVPSLTA